MHLRALCLCVISAVAIVLVQPVYAADEGKIPEALIVFPAATLVSFNQLGESTQVLYQVNTPYPAEEVLKYIKTKLAHDQWIPLENDYLNPRIPSSHVRGWGSFVDRTTSPKTKVRQWLAQWKNSEGDIVWFRFQYRSSVGGVEDLNPLRVVGTYVPRQIAEAQLKAAEEEQPAKKLAQPAR